ncbi:MAG TPA: hypothetical protein VM938_07825 [Acidimicrobiales bacterium]|nr:hypothetical protein [Acidimicrobiales bacterium]
MNRIALTWRVALGVVVLLAALAPSSPAAADCVTAEVAVHRAGQSNITVVPAGTCVVPTPWPQVLGLGGDHTRHEAPNGAPNGVTVRVWLPVP